MRGAVLSTRLQNFLPDLPDLPSCIGQLAIVFHILVEHPKLLGLNGFCWAVEWLNEREEGVYKKDPAYSDKATSLFMLDLGAPQDLPDALRGEAWSFVQLPLGILQEELASVSKVRLPEALHCD